MYGSFAAPAETTAPTHASLIAAIAAFLQPKVYVELGCADGTTFNRVEPHCGKAFAIDIMPLKDYFEHNGWHTFIQSDTVEFLKTLADDSIDMAFLDSSHRYEHTLIEFCELDRKVRTNGVVCFHDSHPPNEELMQDGNCGRVADAMNDIKRMYSDRWEFCTLPAQFGVTIARKNLGKQLLWK